MRFDLESNEGEQPDAAAATKSSAGMSRILGAWQGMLSSARGAAMACCLVLLALLPAGCAGYRVGPTNGEKAGERSIQVHFFKNLTREPRLTESVTTSIRKQLQQDGTYRLATDGSADIVVTGAISKYERSGLSFQPGDVQTVRDFTISIIARVTATERGTGKKLLSDREVEGRTTVRVGTDLVSAERQAVPLIAEDLARRVTSLLTEGDW